MKVLILTAGFGEGHNAAARNLRNALLELGPPDSAQVLDLVRLYYGKIGELAQKGYLMLINHAAPVWRKFYEALDRGDMLGGSTPLLFGMRDFLARLLAREKPDAVVSTWPLYPYLFAQIFAEKTRPFPLITIVTDSITINAVWHRAPSDFYIVPNEQTAEVMRKAGVDAEKILTLGFPVPLIFSKNNAPKIAPNRTTPARVLYMINSSKPDAPTLVEKLAALPNVELTITTGKNAELKTALEQATARAGRPVEIFGWTDKMPDLLARSHVLIGKAGGASVQETIAAKTPMIVSSVVPGQEEGNMRLIVENNCGALAQTPDEIAAAVAKAFANDSAIWKTWHENITRLSKPGAAMDVARFVLARAEEKARAIL